MERNLSFEQFDLRSTFWDLLKNIWVILLAVIAAYFGVTGVYQLQYVPEYTSTATLAVTMRGNNGGSYSSLSMTSEMAGVFSEVFQSEALREKIAQEMGVDSIQGDISISLISETNLMVLQVTSDTPRNAYEIILSALNNYDTVSDYLFSNAKLDTVSAPNVPYGPSNPMNVSRMRKLGMLAAGAVAALAIILLSFFRFTVKKKKLAAKMLDGRILGCIPYTRKYHTLRELFRRSRRRKGLLISTVTLGMPFIESVKRVATSLERQLRRKEEKVLLITSAEENEGKSSVASNLALAMADKGMRVILIDGDLKKPSLHKIFHRRLSNGPSVSDFVLKGMPLEEVLTRQQENLEIVFQYHGMENSAPVLSGDSFAQLVAQCRARADFVIIDSTPMNVAADAEILSQYADAAAITVRQDWAEVGVINDVADALRQSKADFAGYILNAFHQDYPWQSGSYGYYGYYGHYEHLRKTAGE